MHPYIHIYLQLRRLLLSPVRIRSEIAPPDAGDAGSLASPVRAECEASDDGHYKQGRKGRVTQHKAKNSC